MKICFSGAHRTGKTSLAERIAVDNDFIMQYTEVSKVFKNQSVKEAEKLEGKDGFYNRLLLQEKIHAHVTKQINQCEKFSVFDRSLLDVHVYSEYFLSNLLNQFKAQPDDFFMFNSHLDSIRKSFEFFDFTFIIQPGIEFVDDDNSGSREIQEQLNEIFLNTADFHLPKEKYFVMPKEVIDFEERVKICQDVIDKQLELALLQ